MTLTQRVAATALAVMGALGAAEASAAMKAISRANCAFFVNESITYDRPFFRKMQGSAASTHHAQGELKPRHTLGAPNNGTFSWRFRAGDQSHNERITVKGYHTWIFQNVVYTRNTYATNCNLTEW
ncbi:MULTISPECIES: hypothetical protein [unclassified Stenotrophomonas]|uniref:hypothetical protein n=1 Tax=unclassified Stenotrophomonas TaxID=196198 RepID=UPI00249B1F7E|nr:MULTISPECIES: hypothetical protein [unclassified Stenotrophomonas]